MEILNSFLVQAEGQFGQGTLPLTSFEGLRIPTRLLWGQDDPILPVSQAANVWAGADVTLIAGAGHMLLDEAPDVVAAALAAALAKP